MRSFETGQTVVRRDVHRSGRMWSEQALRVLTDTGEALVTACAPGAPARWPALYAQARTAGDRSLRREALDAMASGRWDLADAVWQETDLLLWQASQLVRQLRAPYPPTEDGFDPFDLTAGLLIDPDLFQWQ